MMKIHSNENFEEVYHKHFSLTCPHCGAYSGITAISIPRYELVKKFSLKKVGIVYKCDVCNEPIFLCFKIDLYSGFFEISEEYDEVEKAEETYAFKYLPQGVSEDFREALICYSNGCYNAFGAMCRRCVQSLSAKLGTEGKDKVTKQIKELKDMAEIDNETFEILNQIIIAGHDGAHPHLPALSPERAKILLELMKDVIYQLIIRKAKIEESMKLRKEMIEKEN